LVLAVAAFVVNGDYTPTVGLESESDSMQLFQLKSDMSNVGCLLGHADDMAQTAAASTHYDKLRMMYLRTDGPGSQKHVELILGPHSLTELKDGLTAQQRFFDGYVAFCSDSNNDRLFKTYDSKPVVALDDYLKTNPSGTAGQKKYNMEIMDPKNSGCKWYIKVVKEKVNVDTQVTYTVPLSKLGSDEFLSMPRSDVLNSGVKTPTGCADWAKKLGVAFSKLNDGEIKGLLQLTCQFSIAVLECSEGATADCFKNNDGQLIKAALQQTYLSLNSVSKTNFDEWWADASEVKNFGSKHTAINVRVPKLATVQALADAVDIDKFVVIGGYTKKDLIEPIANVWQFVLGNIFNHHFISIFNPEAIMAESGEGSYMKLCSNKKLKTLFKQYDLTSRAETSTDYDIADNFLCGDIKTAVEAYKPLKADGGGLYLVVESRSTASAFNRAFFPCSTNTKAKGACGSVYDFHNIDGNLALKAQWDKLHDLQTLPSSAPHVVGVLSAPLSERQQQGLVEHIGAISSPNVGRPKVVMPPSLLKTGVRQKSILVPSLQ